MNDLKHNRPTVLLLDDDVITLTLTASMLKKVNINTVRFQASWKALKYLENNTVDMIIQDVIRPGHLNGIEFLKIILNNDKLKNIPILFVTFMEHKYIKESVENFNLQYYNINSMMKPCRQSELYLKISYILSDTYKDKYISIINKLQESLNDSKPTLEE